MAGIEDATHFIQTPNLASPKEDTAENKTPPRRPPLSSGECNAELDKI
jgi:hypothetical protein